MKKCMRLSLCLLVGALLISFSVMPAEAKETIKIGFFAPITGPAAADGMSAKNAVELGAKEVNEGGGDQWENGRTDHLRRPAQG